MTQPCITYIHILQVIQCIEWISRTIKVSAVSSYVSLVIKSIIFDLSFLSLEMFLGGGGSKDFIGVEYI